jgi:hypothetical protein
MCRLRVVRKVPITQLTRFGARDYDAATGGWASWMPQHRDSECRPVRRSRSARDDRTMTVTRFGGQFGEFKTVYNMEWLRQQAHL